MPFYAILRSVPHKLGGVIAMLFSIIVLSLLPWLHSTEIRSSRFRPIYKYLFWVFIFVCLILGWIGGCPVEFERKLNIYYMLYKTTEAVYLYQKSAISSCTDICRSINKNMLLLSVLFGLYCFKTKMRFKSYCQSKFISICYNVFNKKWKNVCPSNQSIMLVLFKIFNGNIHSNSIRTNNALKYFFLIKY